MKGVLKLTLILGLALAGGVSCKRSQEAARPSGSEGSGTTKAEAASPKESSSASLEAVEAADLDVGRALKADGRVTDRLTRFSPNDTIYVVVVSKGSVAGVKIQTLISYQTGAIVFDSSKVVDLKGPTTTAFQATNSSGWPVGKYQLRVVIAGKSYRTWDFEVK
jgi:hypothetical protein